MWFFVCPTVKVTMKINYKQGKLLYYYAISNVYHNIMQVHPIFMLSIADLLLSLLWMIGSGVWLRGIEQRVWCYAISLLTIVSDNHVCN